MNIKFLTVPNEKKAKSISYHQNKKPCIRNLSSSYDFLNQALENITEPPTL